MVRHKKTEQIPSPLDEARREAETRLAELRGALHRELGTAPVRRGWWLVILASSAGLALALGRARRRRDAGDDA